MWLAKLHQDGRVGERHLIDADATLRTVDDEPIDIIITDVSATGCLFVAPEPIDVGSAISIGFAGLGKLKARVVRAGDNGHGAEFATPLDEAALLTAIERPSDTILPLAFRAPLTAMTVEIVATDDRWPRPVRFLVISALVLGSWGLVLALLSLL